MDEILDEINTGSQCSKLFSKVKNGLKYLYSTTIKQISNSISTMQNQISTTTN